MEPADNDFPTATPAADVARAAIPPKVKWVIALVLVLLAAIVGSGAYFLLIQSESDLAVDSAHAQDRGAPRLPIQAPLPAPPIPVGVPVTPTSSSSDPNPDPDVPPTPALQEALAHLAEELSAYRSTLETIGATTSRIVTYNANTTEALATLSSSMTSIEARLSTIEKQLKSRQRHAAAKPSFVLTSVYRFGSTAFADVRVRDGSKSLRLGESVNDWTLSAVDPTTRSASFQRAGRTVVLHPEN